MKKLVFLFVAFAAVSFASCGGNKTSNTEASTDSVAVAAIEEATPCCGDTTACDSAKACCGDTTACDSTKACCKKNAE